MIGKHKIAYLILSHGEKGIGAYNSNGIITNSCNEKTLETENCNGNEKFISEVFSIGADENYYDDIMTWETKELLNNSYQTYNKNILINETNQLTASKKQMQQTAKKQLISTKTTDAYIIKCTQENSDTTKNPLEIMKKRF